MAEGSHLYPFRTQKSSLVAAIILLCGKLARCRIIQIGHLNGWPFVCPNEICGRSKATRFRCGKHGFSDCEEIAYLYNAQTPQTWAHYIICHLFRWHIHKRPGSLAPGAYIKYQLWAGIFILSLLFFLFC